MKIYLITALFSIVLLLMPDGAFASCMAKSSVRTEAEGASVIFIGTVKKTTPAQAAGAMFSGMDAKYNWQISFQKIDEAEFLVKEGFKGVGDNKIKITTSAEGDAGYKFDGGTWLKEGETYLVYAFQAEKAGEIPKDLPESLLKAYKAFPKDLAKQINEFNSKISAFGATVCGRTIHINGAAEEIEQIRKMFPDAKQFNNETDIQKKAELNNQTVSFWQRFLAFFGAA